MAAAPAAVVSDILPSHTRTSQNHSKDSTSSSHPDTREGIASVAATLKARLAAASQTIEAPQPASQQHHTTTMETNTSLAPQTSQTPTPAPTPMPTPVPMARASPVTNAPASSAPAVPVAAIINGSNASQRPTPPPLNPSSQPSTRHASPAVPSAPLQPSASQGNQRPVLVAPHATPVSLPSMPSFAGTAPRAGQQSSPTGFFRSPTMAKHQAQAPADSSQDYHELSQLIQRASASVVRQALRDQWHKCLAGSDYHSAFIANAIFHQASPSTLSRAIQDFGEGLVKASKHQIIHHLSTEDFDELASAIFPKLSNKFTDQALARRLETIGAQDLVNALARAERLGYDIHDVVEGKHGARGEHVIPSMISAGPPPVPSQSVQVPPVPQSRVLSSQQHPSPGHPTWVYTPGMATPTGTPQGPPTAIPTNPKPSPSTRGPAASITYCNLCRRPCSGPDALNYHLKKAKCQVKGGYETSGKEICIHCGCRFGGSGGLTYHERSNVCGSYTLQIRKQMIALLENPTAPSAPVHQSQSSAPAPPPGSATQQRTPRQLAATSTPVSTKFASTPTPSSSDPYAKLTPEERANFEAEMRQGEEVYGKLMQEAMKLPQPQQDDELTKLKNRYNTRQSLTRKKYGIRLRERRPQAEIEAERIRLFGPGDSNQKGHAAKKARISNEGQAKVTQPGGPTTQTESPRKRVPVTEMGGLSGSSATAELVDPTASTTPSQPRHLQQSTQPPNGAAPKALVQETQRAANQGTSDDPMQIDTSDNSSDTDSDDDDIPAKAVAA